MRDVKTSASRKALTLMVTAGLAVAALAATQTARTGAAYQDLAHARSEGILVAAPAPSFQPGLALNSRMVDTGLGLGEDGNVYQWGRTNLNIGGSVPDPGTFRAPTKIPDMPEGGICQVTGQIYDANALACDGTIWGWGANDERNGTDAQRPGQAPQQVRIQTAWNSSGAILDGIKAIGSTEYASAGIRQDGTVWIWGGSTGYGGNGGTLGASQLQGLPDPSVAGNKPVYLKGAYTNFFVILENGDVWYWGGTGGNSLPAAHGNVNSNPAKLTALQPWFKSEVSGSDPYVVAVDGGINMGGAILSDGTYLSWGSVTSRIGDRGGVAGVPALVPTLTGVKTMQFGFTGVAFAMTNGDLWGYGASDDYGRLPTTPTLVDTNIRSYSVGQGFYIWQKANGEFWARGYNPAGAIGAPGGQINNDRQVSYDMSAVTQ